MVVPDLSLSLERIEKHSNVTPIRAFKYGDIEGNKKGDAFELFV